MGLPLRSTYRNSVNLYCYQLGFDGIKIGTLSALRSIVLVLFSVLFFYLQDLTEEGLSYWFYSNGMVLLRVGGVILINGMMAFIVRKLNSIPALVLKTGKKTLLLYVLHILILYCCAWFPFLYKYYAKSFTTLETIIATILMLGAMLAIVQFSDKINMFKKRKIALNKI